jgi:uncharacterized membrane protein
MKCDTFSNCSYLENISRKILCCKLRVCGNTGCQKKKQYNVSLIAVQSNEEEEIICLLTYFYFSILFIIIIVIILFYILLLLLSLFFFWGVLPVDFIYFKDCFLSEVLFSGLFPFMSIFHSLLLSVLSCWNIHGEIKFYEWAAIYHTGVP